MIYINKYKSLIFNNISFFDFINQISYICNEIGVNNIITNSNKIIIELSSISNHRIINKYNYNKYFQDNKMFNTLTKFELLIVINKNKKEIKYKLFFKMKY